MAKKNDVQVLIGGKIYTLSGYESNDYLQKVASYINHKIQDIMQNENYRHLGYEMRHTLIELNIADDYFKAKKQADLYDEDLENKNKEIYDLKHELIAIQLKLENANKRIEQSETDMKKVQKRIIQLEAELDVKE